MFGDIESTFAEFYDDANQELTADVNNGSVSTVEADTGWVSESESPYVKTWTQSGATPDERFDAAVSAASDYETVLLENAVYSSTHTINKRVTVVGPASTHSNGALIRADVTCDDRVIFDGIRLCDSAQITFNALNSGIQNCNLFNSNGVVINANLGTVVNCQEGPVTFASGTDRGVVDACRDVTVTDNGTNLVGDIA
jgi:hypothetical protein